MDVTTKTAPTGFLVVAPQSQDRGTTEAPPAPGITSWSSMLETSTASLRQARDTKSNQLVIGAARNAVDAALKGALASIEARLRTFEDGAEASALLASVAAAYESIATGGVTTPDSNAIADIIIDFKARCAAAERCWLSPSKAGAYKTAFSALAAELSDFPDLALKIEKRRTTAMECGNEHAKVVEFRTSVQRTLADLARLAGPAAP
jgi:hypothetical protein